MATVFDECSDAVANEFGHGEGGVQLECGCGPLVTMLEIARIAFYDLALLRHGNLEKGLAANHITTHNTQTLTGSAEAGSMVKLYDGATLLGSAAANGSGAWSYTTSALANGGHSLSATATDAAGNTGVHSAALTITVATTAPTPPAADTTAPTAPAIIEFSTDSGVQGDHITNDNTLSLAGSAEAGSTVKLYDGATLLGSALASGTGRMELYDGSACQWWS